MAGYTKLSSSLVTSTVWRESASTRVVWITMLALADQHGEVQASVPGLADAARVSIAECEDALKVFLSPDKYSRTTDFEGRRIEAIDGGWALLNHKKYRHLYSDEERRANAVKRTQRWRENRKLTHNVDAKTSTSVTVDAVDLKQKQKQKQIQELQLPLFDQAWDTYPKRPNNSRQAALKAWSARIAEGCSPETMLDGVVRYANYVRGAGVEAKYVKMASTFFGPNRHWESDYAVPSENAVDAELDAIAAQAAPSAYRNAEAVQAWMARTMAETQPTVLLTFGDSSGLGGANSASAGHP